MEEIIFQDDLISPPPLEDKKGKALVSFAIGIAGIILSFFKYVNLINIPMQIIALVLGIFGLKSSKKVFSIVGITLNIVAIAASIVVSVFSFYNALYVRDQDNVEDYISEYGGISAELKPVYDSKVFLKSKIESKFLEVSMNVIGEKLKGIGIKHSIRVNTSKGTLSVRLANKEMGEKQDYKKLLEDITRVPKLTFQEIDEEKRNSNGDYLPTGRIIVGAADVSAAQLNIRFETTVQVEFTSEGAIKFGEATEKLVGKKIGIFMDDRLISAPTVNAKISGGEAVIEGSKSLEEAKSIVSSLRGSESLPFDFEVQNYKEYQPSKNKN